MSNEDWIKEVFEIFVLGGLIIFRIFQNNGNMIIKISGYVGVIVSVVDLYYEVKRNFSTIDKFHVVRGFMYILIASMAILLVLFLMEIIPISELYNDIFTLLALLITLPQKLYILLIKKYVNGEDNNE